MSVTIIIVALYLGLLIIPAVLWAAFLRLGLRWAKVRDVRIRSIVLTTVAVFALQLALNVLFRFLTSATVAPPLLLDVGEIAAFVMLPCMVIMLVFDAGFGRSLQAWLPTLITAGVTMPFLLFVFKPYLSEAYTISSNPMAPTIRGPHWRGRCPQCGEPNFCSAVDPIVLRHQPVNMICTNFHIREITDVDEEISPADRILAAKFLTPRRWDVVVFRVPWDSSILYVMRLVGLPGETIVVDDGAVWANGNRLAPPDSLGSIEYLSDFPRPPFAPPVWGSPEHPAELGDDEYFVLGDFTAQSADSRLWQEGAPGHHPYAVPESHLEGVVTHIYWPPERWSVLR